MGLLEPSSLVCIGPHTQVGISVHGCIINGDWLIFPIFDHFFKASLKSGQFLICYPVRNNLLIVGSQTPIHSWPCSPQMVTFLLKIFPPFMILFPSLYRTFAKSSSLITYLFHCFCQNVFCDQLIDVLTPLQLSTQLFQHRYLFLCPALRIYPLALFALGQEVSVCSVFHTTGWASRLCCSHPILESKTLLHSL